MESVQQKDYLREYEDICPKLDDTSALVESSRCYYCYDAPCVKACPTGINIPSFIARISEDNAVGAGQKILSDNIMGGTCARVCPVEVLCEGSCVRSINDQPVKIGKLQQYATDKLMESFDRGEAIPKTRPRSTGKHFAVVGAGPAGLSCAHVLAQFGHRVTIYETKEKGGGLNEYGIAPYKMTNNFAQKELSFILSSGDIQLISSKSLGVDITISYLRKEYDSIFLGIGLGQVNTLVIKNEEIGGIINAVDFIARNRQGEKLTVGNDVVVIGGGSTAIDIAIQAKIHGARNVTMFYRRGPDKMSATNDEQQLAKEYNVNIKYWHKLSKIINVEKRINSVEFLYTGTGGDGVKTEVECDMLFKAIGQNLCVDPVRENSHDLLSLNAGKIDVDDDQQTSLSGVFAGGDCSFGGKDLTVQAVQDGKIAAFAMHKRSLNLINK